MCRSCPKSNPKNLVADIRTELQAVLSDMKDAIQQDIKNCEDIEHLSRKAGVLYHKTHIPARQPEHFPLGTERLERLKKHFETKSVDEYHVLFEDMSGLIKRLADMLRTVEGSCRAVSVEYRFLRAETLRDRLHHVKLEVLPTWLALSAELTKLHAHFYDTCADVATLYYTSESFLGSNQHDQWNVFCAWVGSLPEAHRMVSTGHRGVDKIAFELMYGAEEKVLEGVTEANKEAGEDSTPPQFSTDFSNYVL